MVGLLGNRSLKFESPMCDCLDKKGLPDTVEDLGIQYLRRNYVPGTIFFLWLAVFLTLLFSTGY